MPPSTSVYLRYHSLLAGISGFVETCFQINAETGTYLPTETSQRGVGADFLETALSGIPEYTNANMIRNEQGIYWRAVLTAQQGFYSRKALQCSPCLLNPCGLPHDYEG